MKKHLDISIAAPLVLFAVFVILASAVLLAGAGLYKGNVEADRTAWEERTAADYIAMRVRQSDAAGRCFVGDFDEKAPRGSGDTFFYLEEYEGVLYSTRIYAHGGWLYELFAPHEAEFSREDGQRLTPLDTLSFTLESGRLTAVFTHTGGHEDMRILTLRSFSEVLP